MQPIVHPVFEKKTSTWQYIVACPSTKHAAIIDPVLDFDPASAAVSTQSADQLLSVASSQNYTVTHLLETHAHADHLTAAHYLQKTLPSHDSAPVPACIGEGISSVQKRWAKRYDIPDSELENAFDKLFHDDEEFKIGELSVKVMRLPGHTPDHVGYLIGDNVFAGDSIFNPDVGSARCDFPGGDSQDLYNSMMRLLALPDHAKLYTGHDYPPAGDQTQPREPLAYVTVKEQKERNKHVGNNASKESFITWRTERDESLQEPRLIHQALQINIRGGRMPNPTSDGLRLLHVPVKVQTSSL